MFTWIKVRAAIQSPLLQNIENQPQKVRRDKMKKGLQTVILHLGDPDWSWACDQMLLKQISHPIALPGLMYFFSFDSGASASIRKN